MAAEKVTSLFRSASEAQRLREEARQCRWMASTISKPETSDLLIRMAEEYDGRANTLEDEARQAQADAAQMQRS